jgi:hypothetical protein
VYNVADNGNFIIFTVTSISITGSGTQRRFVFGTSILASNGTIGGFLTIAYTKNGSSGTSGSSGSSGTGFNTVLNPGDHRILTSDGTTNRAQAESTFQYNSATGTVTQSNPVEGEPSYINFGITKTVNIGNGVNIGVFSMNEVSGVSMTVEYYIRKDSTGDSRAGTILVGWVSGGTGINQVSYMPITRTPSFPGNTNNGFLSAQVNISAISKLLSIMADTNDTVRSNHTVTLNVRLLTK